MQFDLFVGQQRCGSHERRLINELSALFMRRDQRLNFSSQIFISGTGLRKKEPALLRAIVDRRVEDLFHLLPAFGSHLYFCAFLWPISARASRCYRWPRHIHKLSGSVPTPDSGRTRSASSNLSAASELWLRSKSSRCSRRHLAARQRQSYRPMVKTRGASSYLCRRSVVLPRHLCSGSTSGSRSGRPSFHKRSTVHPATSRENLPFDRQTSIACVDHRATGPPKYSRLRSA